jgi:solute carrier family 13 (sodium-dependent dicarboxylate transporter), member 2/3/5
MIYNDSRRAAIRIYRNFKFGWIWATSTLIGNILLAVVSTYFFMNMGYDKDINYVFFISILATGLWITETIPPFAVGILIIASLLFGFGTDFILTAHKTPVEMYLGTWTSNVIWLLLGGFFLAEGMNIVGLDRQLFNFTVKKFGQNPERLLFGLMITSAFGSMVMSNTATTAMMVGSVLPLTRRLGKSSNYVKAILVGIPAAATLGGMGTIIGSTPNAIAVGALQEKGIYISFVEWMIFGLPTALLGTYLFWKFLVKKKGFKTMILDLSIEKESVLNGRKTEKIAVIITLIITIGMWLTEPIHRIPIAATSAIPIVLLTLFQVIKSEHVRRLPWDTLMLVAGGLALGIAMVDVGLTDVIMEHIFSLSIPPIGIAIVFAFIGVLLSNIMSNTAASSILIPLGLTLPGIWGFAVPLIVALTCSCALLLPVSTPSNAISYSTGMIEQKDFRKGGLFMIAVGPVLAFIAVLIYAFILPLSY